MSKKRFLCDFIRCNVQAKRSPKKLKREKTINESKNIYESLCGGVAYRGKFFQLELPTFREKKYNAHTLFSILDDLCRMSPKFWSVACYFRTVNAILREKLDEQNNKGCNPFFSFSWILENTADNYFCLSLP